MTADLFLILNKEVSSGTITPEQSLKIGGRYLELQAEKEFTEGEKSAIFRAFVSQVMYPSGDPDIKNTKQLDDHLHKKYVESKMGQQVLFS